MAGLDSAAAQKPDSASEELKALLRAISGQIDDADQRHSGLLQDMHDRLRALGHEAQTMRARVPQEFAHAYARIEDGMQLLAERLQSAESDHKSPRSATVHTPSSHVASMPAVEVVYAASEAPAPLRSAASAPQQSSFAKSAQAIDPFDLIGDTGPNESTDPWDADNAEALTKVYEDSDAALVRRSPEADVKAASTIEVPAPVTTASAAPGIAVMAPTPVVGPARDTEAEREWLDHRLSDIAIRIEQSLSDVRPDGSVLALGQRFSDFENRVGNVLEDVATRSDVEGLRILEAQIMEIASHLEHAEVQFGRLDGIEQQLQLVMEQLSDGRRSQLVDSGARPVEDLEQLANAAADQAASRFAASAKGNGDARRFDEISDLLRALTDERRQGEEQTYTMLDTVQQAMIRMLDRVDALEIAQTRVPVAQHAPQPVPAAVAPAYSSREEVQDFAFERPAAAVQPSITETYSAQPSYAAEPASVVAEGASRPSRSAVDKLRQDFVADAQRAKMRAAAEADAVSIRPKAAIQEAAPPTKPRTPITAPESANGKAPAASRKLMVTAVVLGLVIAASGGSFLMSSRKPSPVPAAPIANDAEAAPTAVQAPKTSAEKPQAALEAQPMLPAADAVPLPTPVAPNAETTEPPDAPRAAEVTPPGKPKAEPKPSVPAAPLAADPMVTEPVDKQGQAVPPVKERYPGNAKKPSIPETSEEGLGMDMEMPDGEFLQQKGEKTSEDATVMPEGIVLQRSDRVPTPQAIAHLQNQQATANLSSRVGSAAAKLGTAALMPEEVAKARAKTFTGSTAIEDPVPTDAAFVPDDLVASRTAYSALDAARAAASGERQSSLALPPATVGPLSLRTAAASGDPSAQFEVGARLAEGKGTMQNFKEAQAWYQRSAAQGFAQAQYRLGTLFERGLGAKADPGRARMWYQRAAEQGNVKAMHNLAVLSASRDAASPDYGTAAQWFGKASEYGLADSQFNLAVLHENGLGVAKDLKQAYKWYALAARSGDKEALKRRDAAKIQLSADDLFDAEQLVESYMPKRVEPMINDARMAGEDWKKRQADQDNG